MKKHRWLIGLALLLISIGLAGCGSDKSDHHQSSTKTIKGTTLNVTATNFQFDSKTYKVPANKELTIHFESKEGNHGMSIEGTKVDIKGKGMAKVKLKPGTYMVHCSVFCGSGHADMMSKIIAE
ncbi:hypothetical protein GCM10011391_34140 [Pullulanibacillus camelliae]|uniref:Cytochrome C oxidase subunit II n=1 Tax=Pullulanibacillus camelliae TaxID=1707096 RepID=A0A8J2YLP5_9BACL|nr:cytochrome C oxidase subunit II [Pullulanibacillus camelliae]GGE52436.1 hypothetical protein GCM10011391_34140 [Pullulanibacillus camelliae]